jgi:exodeoxyribonuclease VII large subunit
LGTWFEQFLKLKAQLEAEGLFATDRKRSIPERPRAIGVVTSLGAAALHDVATALQRRVPHIPVILSPALVQGVDAPVSLLQALQAVVEQPKIDVILLVLWAFNDEQLARAIVACPVPVISGVGHETDFTIADFCADLRAPTPTAAAELCAISLADLVQHLMGLQELMQNLGHRQIDKRSQGLDLAQSRIGRPSQAVSQQVLRLTRLGQSMHQRMLTQTQTCQHDLQNKKAHLARALEQTLQTNQQRMHRAQLRLELLDPKLVLQRGFAWLTDAQGAAVSSVAQANVGQPVRATLADGVVDLTVSSKSPN